ncbi:MAG TPA: MotE family protein [Hyphomicrobiaceae bacterium]|nr:MotE family protein [Hyphomicrobiaceae bacterium]
MASPAFTLLGVIVLAAVFAPAAVAQGWNAQVAAETPEAIVPQQPLRSGRHRRLKVVEAPPPAVVEAPRPPVPRSAQETAPAKPAAAEAAKPKLKAEAVEARPAQDYCVNIANAAADARYMWQKKALTDIEKELQERVAKLEAKVAEYQQWLARRDEFSKKAQATLISIYSRMRPDAAALQLADLDIETAAAVLTKLDPRVSSAILAEMNAKHAARLTATISGAASKRAPRAANPPPQPEDKGS